MRRDDYGRAGLLAATVGLAVLAYMATCGTAHAEPHTIQFTNPGPTLAYDAIITPWGTQAVTCTPGATCSVVVDVPWGQYPGVTIKGVAGAGQSGPSNALDRKVYPSDVERADFDGSRTVNVSDFGRFFFVLGKSW